MNPYRALLDSLRGSTSKPQFAHRLRITHRALNYIEAGRKPGRRVIERLLAEYPEHARDIIQVFLGGAS